MKRKIPFTMIAVLALLCTATLANAQSGVSIGVDQKLGTLVSTQWLSDHLSDPDLVVIDCSVTLEQDDNGGLQSVSGRASFDTGHIPGARFADLVSDLSDTNSDYQFAMPSAEQFGAAMGALGVSNNSRVVLYDSYGSVWAARVWWMLRWAGFDRVALLDGGLGAWKAEGRELSIEATSIDAQQFVVSLRPELIADRDEVFNAIGNDAVQLIDAMPESHYRGEMVMYDWPGHIPGASNTPAFSLLNESGHYREPDELSVMLNGNRDNRTITYCGGGISASSDAFILHRLGFSDVAVYIGSLQEWTKDTANPMEVETP